MTEQEGSGFAKAWKEFEKMLSPSERENSEEFRTIFFCGMSAALVIVAKAILPWANDDQFEAMQKLAFLVEFEYEQLVKSRSEIN